ncbi:hypothetical protein A6V39_00580 [Candidatus Mycoplasma haematobovis]|uniref:Uncharacterized protein n=1 Tax=Candidatus Mycoplasma haematobovis TaxID=432608 RepID=A0A1A9QF17_9MOLU|nr:hypothetical protein [Candidatus Mycoplasma haematobovis]OAL10546.1 hypothetical protein A6V39_00580 [Candidatus Mycoplasma haematobovis]
MHSIAKTGIALTLLTGTSVAAYYTKDYFSERIDQKLQGIRVNDEAGWSKKQQAIKKASAAPNALVDDLAKIKEDIEKIKQWCQNNYRAYYDGEKDTRFKNVQTYCIYNNKDKLPEGVIEENGDWTTANGVLTSKQPADNLSTKMQEIKTKLSGVTPPNTNALKEWCLAYYEEIWKETKTDDFKDAETYCVKKTSP